jgi:hypothetical protein
VRSPLRHCPKARPAEMAREGQRSYSREGPPDMEEALRAGREARRDENGSNTDGYYGYRYR